MGQTDILYKVIALYLLDKSESSLSKSAICEFFVRGNYTDYFTAASVIANLNESGLLDIQSTNNTTLYSVNESGRATLNPMLDRISPEIRLEVETYLSENELSFKAFRELISDYDRATYGGFTVHLRANEENTPVIDLHIHVSNENMAKSICTNWKQNYEKVYETIMENLV